MNLLLIGLVTLPLVIAFLLLCVKQLKASWLTSVITASACLIATIYMLLNVTDQKVVINLFTNFNISFGLSRLSIVMGITTAAMFIVSLIASKEYLGNEYKSEKLYYASLLITMSGCFGIFFAKDLLTLFIFFELMSFTSYIWVAIRRTEESAKASVTYLCYGVFGGIALLLGITVLYAVGGTIQIDELKSTFDSIGVNSATLLSMVLMFIGFGAKAGAFFLHNWLPVSYTASPEPATALLSGLLSKAGIYGILIVVLKVGANCKEFALFILIIALLNMLVGALYALNSSNLKKTLAYSSMSQIGFILFGIAFTALLGEHGAIASAATILHMINHSIIKLNLFNNAGIIYKNTNSLDLNEIQGFGKDKPLLKFTFAISAFSLAGVPLLSGYISKTLLHESAVEFMHLSSAGTFFSVAEILFLISGGFTLAYMLKLFICIFVKTPKQDFGNKQYASQKLNICLAISTILIVIFGVVPHMSFDLIASFASDFFEVHALEHSVHYFNWTNLQGSLISIVIGLVLYFVLARNTVVKADKYVSILDDTLTVERFIYRPILKGGLFFLSFIFRIFDVFVDVIIVGLSKLAFKSVKIPQDFYEGKPEKNYIYKKNTPHITYSLSFSLLLFGIGFTFTLVYLIALVF